MRQSAFLYGFRFPLVLALFGLLSMGIFSKRGYLDWQRIVKDNEDLTAKLVQARHQRDGLEKQCDLIQSDPQEQERVVRLVLGYVKRNETVIEFQ